MEQNNSEDYSREYAPYESAPAFLSRKLSPRDKVQFSFIVKGSSDFRDAQALEQELMAWENIGLSLKLMKSILNSDLAEGTQWRLTGISAPSKLPSEKVYYNFIGRLWAIAAHYGGLLVTCTFRLHD